MESADEDREAQEGEPLVEGRTEGTLGRRSPDSRAGRGDTAETGLPVGEGDGLRLPTGSEVKSLLN